MNDAVYAYAIAAGVLCTAAACATGPTPEQTAWSMFAHAAGVGSLAVIAWTIVLSVST